MPKTVTFKFEGGRELQAALAEIESMATRRNTAMRSLKRAAEPIRAEAERLAPEDTGDLKQSVKTGKAIAQFDKRMNRGDRVTTFVGIDESVNKELHIYAPIDEFGNEHQAARPFVRPAWERKREEARDRLADDLRTEIAATANRAARKAARKAKG